MYTVVIMLPEMKPLTAGHLIHLQHQYNKLGLLHPKHTTRHHISLKGLPPHLPGKTTRNPKTVLCKTAS